jgi:ubiquinone/menaquinone biosynthesis C-methylase UbiE
VTDPEQINADQLAFWNGQGGHTWVARREHTDITLAPMTEALLAFAAPRPGERVLDIGCGCGATTLEFARAVGPAGRVAALDISGPMLAEGKARAETAGISNVDWELADAATVVLSAFDLLTSAFGLMFFGDPVAAFAHMRRAANTGARMAFVCWRQLDENPWMQVPMNAAARHLPPRPKAVPNAPGMFAFADPRRVFEVLTEAGWARRVSTNSTSIWTSPPAAGWKRQWFSAPGSAPLTAGCPTSLRRSSQPPSRPSAKRWRRIWMARAYVSPVRCGWSAARLSERARPLWARQ